ncbi:MAG TPA: hypothetical protein DDY70_07060 [Clostridiales bacterium]|nr:hypothetical protein [Clostridiales bacterium]
MFFSKPERKKKKHPILCLMAGTFAVVGIGSLVSASKNMIEGGMKKMKQMFCKCEEKMKMPSGN